MEPGMESAERDVFLKWWEEARTEGQWAAAWPRLVDGLTAEQAAWQPTGRDGSARHSIWQIVGHIVFWRENHLWRLEGGGPPPAAELEAGNFPQPERPSQEGWAAMRRRLEESHERIAAAVRERGAEAAAMVSFLPHDAYHMGQIAYVRALLGLPPID